MDPELAKPTANLPLLQQAATATEAVGGAYQPVDDLPAVLAHLAETDRRRRIDTAASFDLRRERPWWLLFVAAGALALEWVVRKRAGMP